jgi:hypothetical protein
MRSRQLCTFRAFGVRVIKPSPVLKACSPLLDHKDKSVRDGAKELAVRVPLPAAKRFAVRCTVLLVTLTLRTLVDSSGGTHSLVGRGGGEARFHGQDARRPEEGGSHSALHCTRLDAG